MTDRERVSRKAMWQVQKQSDGEVVFTGESWEEANEVAHILKRARGYNHNLLIIVCVPEQEQTEEQKRPGPTCDPWWAYGPWNG